jgi:proline iminopeptidase
MPYETRALTVLQNLRRNFSWRIALGFLVASILFAALFELGRRDYERSGFVRGPEGLWLAYEMEGQGPPLIALAGGPGISHHGFHPYLSLLRDAATLVYFDGRGRGESDPAPSYRVADDVRDLETVREALGLGEIDLLGVSYGAHLALAYALEYPAGVRRLVLVSPVVGRDGWREHLRLLAEAPGMTATLARVRKDRGEVRLSHASTRARIAETLQPLYWCTERAGRRAGSVFRPWHRIARQNFDVYEAIVGRPFPELNGDLSDSTVGERLAEVRAPVLVVLGGCDRVAPPDEVRRLVERLPRACLAFLPDAGHSPFIEAPEAFASRVREWLVEPVEDSADVKGSDSMAQMMPSEAPPRRFEAEPR